MRGCCDAGEVAHETRMLTEAVRRSALWGETQQSGAGSLDGDSGPRVRGPEVCVEVHPQAGGGAQQPGVAVGAQQQTSGDQVALLHSSEGGEGRGTGASGHLVPDEWEAAAVLARHARDGRLEAASEGLRFCAAKCALGMKAALVVPRADSGPRWGDTQCKAVLELLIASSACLSSTATSGALGGTDAETLNYCLVLAARLGSDEAARLCLINGSHASTRLLVSGAGADRCFAQEPRVARF